MEYELQEFYNEKYRKIRAINYDGNIWFIASDVAKALGYKYPQQAIQKYVPFRHKSKGIIRDFEIRYKGRVILINEDGLLDLLLNGKRSADKEFMGWFTTEIIDKLYAAGSGKLETRLDELKGYTKREKALFKQSFEDKRYISSLEKRIAELEYKGEYYDKVLMSEGSLIPVTLISKDYGMSAAKMNALLNIFKIQYKTGCGAWVLYSKYDGMGYTQTKTFVISDGDDDKTTTVTFWTEKGREFIYRVLKEHGILPKT